VGLAEIISSIYAYKNKNLFLRLAIIVPDMAVRGQLVCPRVE
jgi:hypothetical protein